MEAKVVRWGDDLAVRLSADEVRQLGVREGEVVEVRPALASPAVATGAREEAIVPSPRAHSATGIPVYTLEEMIAEARRLGPDFEPPSVDWGPDRGSEVIDDDDPR
ncbi:MazF family transcriptional regulator [Methylorubrum podarium]|uniref:MazF family transcriptional regulator n=1 Tax=Methylorubrum podarium TaxID=200476 RepID=A0ABV1QMS8_9HYPH